MASDARDVTGLRAVAALLAAQPDPESEVALWRQLCREAYKAGRAEGRREGYERGARLLEAQWPQIVAAVVSGAPPLAELELRRWGPGGRERFGDPRPGDRISGLEAAS